MTRRSMHTKAQEPMWKAIYIILLVTGIYFLYRVISAARSTATAVLDGVVRDTQAQEVRQVLTQSGISDVRVKAVQTIVNEIYNAFYKDAWFGYGEDEQKAKEQFNLLQNVNEAKTAAALYKEIFGKSLYNDFTKYLYGIELSGINQLTFQAIKGM